MTSHYISVEEVQEKAKRLRGREYWWEMSEEAHKEIEEVVGSRWVSRDKVARLAYVCRGYNREFVWFAGQAFPPCCVVLPATIEEVAELVKICNRYNLAYCPASSGWIVSATPRFRADVVLIDLQRMWEWKVDVENKRLTLGPGVRYGFNAQGCFEYDCWFMNPGGGSAACVIPNHLNWGLSPLNYRMGNAERRMMGIEWVSPEGDIVCMGSWSQEEEGFWGDSPGPNLAGILRGHVGQHGSMGIVTRMTLKMFTFVEDTTDALVPEGISPRTHLTFKDLNKIRWINVQFPTRQAMQDCIYKLSHAQVGGVITKVPVFWRVLAASRDRADYRDGFWQDWNKVTKEEIDNFHILRILVCAFTSQKQLEYEVRVLEDIMKEFGGKIRKTKPSDESWLKNADANGMWMMTSGYVSCDGAQESLRCAFATGARLGNLLYEKYGPPVFMNEHADPGWWQANDFGHSGYLEFLVYMNPDHFDPLSPFYKPEVWAKMLKWYLEEVPDIDAETGCTNFFCADSIAMLYQGPHFSDYQVWIDRFKEEFDSRILCNPPSPYDTEQLAELYPSLLKKSRAQMMRAKRGKSIILGTPSLNKAAEARIGGK